MTSTDDAPSRWPGIGGTDIISRTIQVDDLNMHILEAFPTSPPDPSGAPLVLLLHGFPELAYSWREVIPALAAAGYHVVAPDQRGHGRTVPTASPNTHHIPYASEVAAFDAEVAPSRQLNLAKDIVALVHALGYHKVHAVIGHDFGSNVAGNCALIRPDIFARVVMMSAPYTGAPALPFGTGVFGAQEGAGSKGASLQALFGKIVQGLAALDPPRKHYMHYFTTPAAAADIDAPKTPGGLHGFLRAYFHAKSADWAPNAPHPLPAPTADALAEIPEYYIMPANATMSGVALKEAPTSQEIADLSNRWLPEDVLAVYTAEWGRTGFQSALNWYRAAISAELNGIMAVFSGKRIEIPAMYVAGEKDWGTYQIPGALDAMADRLCTKMRAENGGGGVVLVAGAGHWVQQERAAEVNKVLIEFLEKV